MAELNTNLPQAIFFDLDGTLLDSLPGIAFSIERAFEACGLPMRPIDLQKTIGPPIGKILALAAPEASEAEIAALERAFRVSYDSEGWQRTPIFPGSGEMLREAGRMGIPLYVVSNKPRHIATRILEHERLLGLFREIVTRDSSEPPYANKAAMIGHLLDAYTLAPARCVMVGDTAEDAHAASAMQVSFAWVAHGYGESPAETTTHRIDSFSELLPRLVKIPVSTLNETPIETTDKEFAQ